MAIDSDPADKFFPGGAEGGWLLPDGRVMLGVYRSVKGPVLKWRYTLITEPDAAPVSGLLQTDMSYCSVGFTKGAGNRYVQQIFEHDSEAGGGMRAGEIDSPTARIQVHFGDAVSHAPFAGPFTLIDLSNGFTFSTYSWDDGHRMADLWSPAQDDNLQQEDIEFAPNAMFWTASSSAYKRVHVYTPDGGVKNLLSAGLDISHAYADLGTDGHDLVWMEGKGRASASDPFTTYDIVTAPFTTDPAQVAPRRLRSEQGPALGASPFVVGCGFAARDSGSFWRVVRLADGTSWTLTKANGWGWGSVHALSCAEIFVTVVIENVFRLARVRLDSLGVATPPD
jgi:hypothetical protein